MSNYEDPKSIYNAYMSGKIEDANEAARMISECIGGVTKVKFKPGKSFTIRNSIQGYSLPSEVKKKEMDKVLALLAALYTISKGHVEYHLGKRCSSKHHKDGLIALLEAYAG